MFKVNNKNNRTRQCRPERRHWRVLLSLLLVLKYFKSCSCVFIVDFEEVNAAWK